MNKSKGRMFSKLKKFVINSFSNKEVKEINIYCENCHKFLGTKTKRRYNLSEGVIQFGKKKDNPKLFQTFCNNECFKKSEAKK